MKAAVGHIGINLSNEGESFDFWKGLLTFLEFDIVLDGNHFDATDGRTYLCVQVTKPGHDAFRLRFDLGPGQSVTGAVSWLSRRARRGSSGGALVACRPDL